MSYVQETHNSNEESKIVEITQDLIDEDNQTLNSEARQSYEAAHELNSLEENFIPTLKKTHPKLYQQIQAKWEVMEAYNIPSDAFMPQFKKVQEVIIPKKPNQAIKLEM